MRATICAGTTVVPRREARSAHSVVANLTGRAAVCARVTRAEALAVSHTTNRRRARAATIATLVAERFVVSSITRTFARRRRARTEDFHAPLGTLGIATGDSAEEAAYSGQTE